MPKDTTAKRDARDLPTEAMFSTAPLSAGFESLGFNAGDVLTLEDAWDARPGELLIFSCRCGGREFCCFVRCELLTERTFTFTYINGERHRHDRATLTCIARPVAVTRRLPHATSPGAEGRGARRPVKVKHLSRQSSPRRQVAVRGH